MLPLNLGERGPKKKKPKDESVVSKEERGMSEQRNSQKSSLLQTNKIEDVPQSDSLLISSRTRSKAAVVKSVQTEPATVTVGTNTYSVLFDNTTDSPTVTEFQPYRTTNQSDFIWSEAHDRKNLQFDYYARLLGTDWWNRLHEKRAKKTG